MTPKESVTDGGKKPRVQNEPVAEPSPSLMDTDDQAEQWRQAFGVY